MAPMLVLSCVAVQRTSQILTVRSRKLPMRGAHVKKRGFVDSVDRSEQLSPRTQEKPPTFSILYKPMLSVSQENFPKIT